MTGRRSFAMMAGVAAAIVAASNEVVAIDEDRGLHISGQPAGRPSPGR